MAGLHAAGPFDLVHAFWLGTPSLLAVLAARRLGVPALVSIGGGELVWLPQIGYGGQGAWRERIKVALSLRLAQAITAGSQFVQAPLAGRGLRAEWVPLGVDAQFYDASPTRPDGPPWRLLHVATLNRVKDPATLLHALRLVADRQPGVELDLVGLDILDGAMQQLAASLGLAGAVRFHGVLPFDEIVPFYRRAHLYVQSSLHESQGVAVCEAAAAGVPTVGTAVGLLAELAPNAALAVPARRSPRRWPAASWPCSAIPGGARTWAAPPRPWARAHDADWTAAQFEGLYRRLAGSAMMNGLRPRPGLARFLFCGLLLAYWAISLHNLTVVPRVYEDEPWQASTGWKLATEGVFGTDLFRGFYGMESRYYGYMPVHPLLLAGVFRLAGLGLFQDRFEPVALGLLTLALTYGLARRLFRDARVGLLAVLLLLTVRWTDLTPFRISGILFVDVVRISRYDMAVPVFGLAALHTYWTARQAQRGRWYFVAGFLAALAGLAHLYGLFWLPVLLLLAVADGSRASAEARTWRSRLLALGPLLLGFVLPWLPYLAYVLGDVAAWRGQTQFYGDRFDLLNWRWYVDNLRLEAQRYRVGLGAWPAALQRVGLWATLAVLPASVIALTWRGWRRGDRAARAIVLPALLIPLLFALLIRLKLPNYLATLLPIWAMAAAWGGVALWRWLGRARIRRARLALALLLLAVVAEGGARLAALEAAAATTTPYYRFIGQVRQYVPAGARVLGLHNYWLGLEDTDYRSFAVPIFLDLSHPSAAPPLVRRGPGPHRAPGRADRPPDARLPGRRRLWRARRGGEPARLARSPRRFARRARGRSNLRADGNLPGGHNSIWKG